MKRIAILTATLLAAPVLYVIGLAPAESILTSGNPDSYIPMYVGRFAIWVSGACAFIIGAAFAAAVCLPIKMKKIMEPENRPKIKRYIIFIAIACWISSLVTVALISKRVAADGVKNMYDPFTVEEIIDFGNGWLYTVAIRYLDGGSWDLGFVDSNGLFIYVTIDYSLGAEHEYRRFYLSKSIRLNRDYVEIKRGSDLERKVINLIEESRDINTDECKVFPEKSDVAALLKSRDIRVIIYDPKNQ